MRGPSAAKNFTSDAGAERFRGSATSADSSTSQSTPLTMSCLATIQFFGVTSGET